MGHFFNKRKQEWKPRELPKPVQNKESIKEDKMDIFNNTSEVADVMDDIKKAKNIKKVKKDKGLIEKVESSKVILTEDNKQLLLD